MISEEKQARDEMTQENKNKRAFEELRALKLKPRFKEPLETQRDSNNQSILLSSLRPQRSLKKFSVQIEKRSVQQQSTVTTQQPQQQQHQQQSTASGGRQIPSSSSAKPSLPQDYKPSAT